MKIPFPHQEQGAKYLASSKGAAYLAWSPRTGKTLTTVLAMREAKAARSVVVCPLSVMPVWKAEMEDHGMEVGVYRGTPKQKSESLRFPHLVINYESIWRLGLSLKEMDVVVLDEAHKVANIRSKVTQYFIARNPSRCWLLSGTPMIESPLQLAGQMFSAQGEFMGWNSADKYLWGKWAWDANRFRFVPLDPMHPKEIQSWFDGFSSKQTAEKLGLPSKLYETIEVEPSWADTARAMGNVKDAGDPSIIALRTQQAMGGWDEANALQGTSAKGEALVQLVRDLVAQGEAVLVCCRFVAEVEWLSDMLMCDCIHGDTSLELRERYRQELGRGANVLVAQVQAIKLGLDFSAANVQVFFSNDWSGEARTQAEDRTRNISKSTPSRIIDLTCGPVDKAISKAVRNKEHFNHRMLNEG